MNRLDGGATRSPLPPPPRGRPVQDAQSPRPSPASGQPIVLRCGDVTVRVLARAGDEVTVDPHGPDGLSVSVNGPAVASAQSRPDLTTSPDPAPDGVECGLIKAALVARASAGIDRARPRDLTALAVRVAAMPEAAALPDLLSRYGEAAVGEALESLYADMGAATGNWENLAVSHYAKHADSLPGRAAAAKARRDAAQGQEAALLVQQAEEEDQEAQVENGWASLADDIRSRLLAEAEAQTRRDLSLPATTPLTSGARLAVEGIAKSLYRQQFLEANAPPGDPPPHQRPAATA